MKKILCCFISSTLVFASCTTSQLPEEKPALEIVADQPNVKNVPIADTPEPPDQVDLPKIKDYINLAELSYNSAVARDFVYNPYDDSFYISLNGESTYYKQSLVEYGERSQYPFDPPEIEQFCRIDAETNKVSLLLDYTVHNLVYSDGYVYFCDPLDEYRIKRIQEDTIEEIFMLSDHYPSRNTCDFSFHVEKNILYIVNSTGGVTVFDLENLEKMPDRSFNSPTDINDNPLYQIFDETIYYFSEEGFQWKKGAGELCVYDKAYQLIEDFYYGSEKNVYINSFLYHGTLLVQCHQDLFLICPETNALDLIANDIWGTGNYTIYNGDVYFILKDALNTYNIETKKTDVLISFLESEDAPDDYYGFENLRHVMFLNDRCFLYMEGMRTYSYPTIAELDLSSKKVVYLADYFDMKSNVITVFYSETYSIEYPNDYNIFNDYGSSGGTLINNYQKHIRIMINSRPKSEMDMENAVQAVTTQGCPLYYLYDGTGTLTDAMITYENDYIRVRIEGSGENVQRYEDDILAILKAIIVHKSILE